MEGRGSEAERVLRDLVGRFRPEAGRGVTAVYDLELTGEGGGRWQVVVGDGRCELREGSVGEPDVRIAMSAEDFQALVEGRLDGMAAYSEGRVQVKGDLLVALHLGEVLGF